MKDYGYFQIVTVTTAASKPTVLGDKRGAVVGRDWDMG